MFEISKDFIDNKIDRRTFMAKLRNVGVSTAGAGAIANTLSIASVNAAPLGADETPEQSRVVKGLSGGEVMAEFLIEWDVPYVFGLAGSEEVGFLDALVDRDHVLRLWQVFLEDYPLMVMPSSDVPAFEVDEDIRDFESYQRLWRAQWPQLALPVLGLPGVAVPTGVYDGLPSGVQIVSRRFREDWCLDAAEVVEARADLALPVSP